MHTAITGNNIAPLLSSDSEIVVPNKYIVVFKKDVDDPSKHYAWLQSIQPNSEDRIELRKRSGDVFTGLNHTYEMSSLWDTLVISMKILSSQFSVTLMYVLSTFFRWCAVPMRQIRNTCSMTVI